MQQPLISLSMGEVTALIDLGVQDSSISLGLCKQIDLSIHLLDRLLKLEGTGRSVVLYTYAMMVSVVVGSKAIDKAISVIKMGN